MFSYSVAKVSIFNDGRVENEIVECGTDLDSAAVVFNRFNYDNSFFITPDTTPNGSSRLWEKNPSTEGGYDVYQISDRTEGANGVMYVMITALPRTLVIREDI